MATILKGAPVVAAMNEANAARCAALAAKGITPHPWPWSGWASGRTTSPMSGAS